MKDVLQNADLIDKKKIIKYHRLRGMKEHLDIYKKFEKYMKKNKTISFLEVTDTTGFLYLDDKIIVLKKDPNNPEYLMEVQYVENNLQTDYFQLLNKYYLNSGNMIADNLKLLENVYKLENPENIKIEIDKFKNDINKEMLFILYNFGFITNNVVYHSTVMILNKKEKLIEIFDPHGIATSENYFIQGTDEEKYKIKYLKTFVEIKFNQIFLNGEYKIKDNFIVCPYLGPQAESQKVEILPYYLKKEQIRGYCFGWSLFFMYYRIKYKEEKVEDIIKIIYDKIYDMDCVKNQQCDPKLILLRKIRFFISELLKLNQQGGY
jgi:hypothetical protein